jgi:NAD(P)-dependent dehydrogenase (short-subunit alcohol dehydrogenase family)
LIAAAKRTVAAIKQAGGRALIVGAKLGVAGDVDTLFAGLRAGLAGRPLDILVNNAGGALGTGSIEETTPEEFDRLIALNMRAVLHHPASPAPTPRRRTHHQHLLRRRTHRHHPRTRLPYGQGRHQCAEQDTGARGGRTRHHR